MADNFGEVAINALANVLGHTQGVGTVLRRSLNQTDANGALGICLDKWEPLDFEMGVPGFMEPTLSQWVFSVQHMVKHVNQEDGEAVHREVAKAVRLMLYRDPEVQVSLRSLYVVEDGRRERFQRFRVTDQRYASNEIKGTFVFLSVTELVIETETV